MIKYHLTYQEDGFPKIHLAYIRKLKFFDPHLHNGQSDSQGSDGEPDLTSEPLRRILYILAFHSCQVASRLQSRKELKPSINLEGHVSTCMRCPHQKQLRE